MATNSGTAARRPTRPRMQMSLVATTVTSRLRSYERRKIHNTQEMHCRRAQASARPLSAGSIPTTKSASVPGPQLAEGYARFW